MRWLGVALALWWLVGWWKRRPSSGTTTGGTQRPFRVTVDTTEIAPDASAPVVGSNLGPYANTSLDALAPESIAYLRTVPYLGPDGQTVMGYRGVGVVDVHSAYQDGRPGAAEQLRDAIRAHYPNHLL